MTCAYMTGAHRKTAAQLAKWMREAGMQTHIDAAGNVIGRYLSDCADAKTLMTGSHYDTVCNAAANTDGREGILLPIAVVKHLHERGEKLPFHVEIVRAFPKRKACATKALSSAAMPSSAASTWHCWTARRCQRHQRCATRTHRPPATIRLRFPPSRAEPPEDLLGFVEIHIEQGPVLLERNLPAGIVTSIAGSRRYLIELTGVASHAGTTPMSWCARTRLPRRRKSFCTSNAAARKHRRWSARSAKAVNVPHGSVNVVPGACQLSLDIRAADDAARNAAVDDVVQAIETICARRNIEFKLEKTVAAPAAPCAPWLMRQLASTAATVRAGVPAFEGCLPAPATTP